MKFVQSWQHLRRSGLFIVNFEQILHIFLVFPLVILNNEMPEGLVSGLVWDIEIFQSQMTPEEGIRNELLFKKCTCCPNLTSVALIHNWRYRDFHTSNIITSLKSSFTIPFNPTQIAWLCVYSGLSLNKWNFHGFFVDCTITCYMSVVP